MKTQRQLTSEIQVLAQSLRHALSELRADNAKVDQQIRELVENDPHILRLEHDMAILASRTEELVHVLQVLALATGQLGRPTGQVWPIPSDTQCPN